ncbi:MAG TPA: DUF2061 domain-containing protein [Victivallales bacterium]|nr:DUF2061 domain-containing protein [Victivallales bacterium]
MKTSKNTESHLRSFLKGLTWRFLATFTTILLAYLVTGEISLAVQIGIFEFVAKLFLYYIHERAWLLVPRGSIRKIYKIFSFKNNTFSNE